MCIVQFDFRRAPAPSVQFRKLLSEQTRLRWGGLHAIAEPIQIRLLYFWVNLTVFFYRISHGGSGCIHVLLVQYVRETVIPEVFHRKRVFSWREALQLSSGAAATKRPAR